MDKDRLASLRSKPRVRLNYETTLASLDAKIASHIEKHVPPKLKKVMIAAYSGKANRRKAIAAKCYDCVGHQDMHTQIGHCTSKLCALWHYRPIKCKKQDCERLT